MKKKIVAIVEARLNSKRLPGKVLKKIKNKSLLEILIDRIIISKKIDLIVVATTNKKIDDSIVKICKQMKIKYYRGKEENVLDRVTKAGIKFKASHVVQLTADNPLVDYNVLDYMLDYFFKTKHKYHYITNNGFGNESLRKIPMGMDVQIFLFSKLKYINSLKLNKVFREHPSLYFYKNKNKIFKIKNVPIPKEWKRNYHLRLTVDTFNDLKLIKKIYSFLSINNAYFSLKDILSYIDKNKSLIKINSKIKQNAIYI